MNRLRPGIMLIGVFSCCWAVVAVTAEPLCEPRANSKLRRLKDAKTWMCQLQCLDKGGAVGALAATDYDVLVIEPTNTVKGNEKWDGRQVIKRLKAKRPDRLVLAYIDIGEAESYRTYWKKDWRPPSKGEPGHPKFIITEDPDGWAENYPVAYWYKGWHKVVIDGKKSLLKRAIADGYDGIYMDWVNAYDEGQVRKVARKEGVDAAEAMVDFIGHLRKVARKKDPEFLVVAQNASYLLDEDRRYARVIDAIALEDMWYRGEAGATWNDPKGGDIPNKDTGKWSTRGRLKQCRKYQKRGKPVFTCDYCLKKKNAQKVYAASQRRGLVPVVTRVSLARLTTTPPPWLAE